MDNENKDLEIKKELSLMSKDDLMLKCINLMKDVMALHEKMITVDRITNSDGWHMMREVDKLLHAKESKYKAMVEI